MATQIKIRRDSYANWFNVNPTLGIGEPGYDTTNRKLKIGDGVTLWRSLSYFDDQVTDLSAYAGSIVPSVDVSQNIGSPAKRWQKGFFSGNAVYLGDIKLSNNNGTLVVQRVTNAGLENEAAVPSTPGSVTTDRLVNGSNTVSLGADGTVTLPTGAKLSNGYPGQPADNSTWFVTNGGVASGDGAQYVQVIADDGVRIGTSWPTSAKEWLFGLDGNLTLPAGGDIRDSNGDSVLGSGSGGSSVTTGVNPPVGPALGDLWYDTASGRTYIYYDSNWIDANPPVSESISLATLKLLVADSSDFADFQIRIAAL